MTEQYTKDLQKLKRLENISPNKAVDADIDAQLRILFSTNEGGDDSYLRHILKLLTSIKNYRIGQVQNRREFSADALKKNNLLEYEQRKLGEVRGTFGEVIDLLTKHIETHAQN